MNTSTISLVQKLWNHCNVLRDHGMSYGDYVYDLRTNKHFTLKTSPLTRTNINEFVELYQAGNRHQRQATWSPEVDNAKGSGPDGRWRAYNYDDLVARDKTSLDIFWLNDNSLADSDNLPAPGVIALEIVEDLQAALEQFKLIAADLNESAIEWVAINPYRTGARGLFLL